ncbi:MAG: twin-arginine translocation signal domain-containing protein, partial [Salinibacter sp.]
MAIDDSTPVSNPDAPDSNILSSDSTPSSVSRRDFLRSAGALTALAGVQAILPGWA